MVLHLSGFGRAVYLLFFKSVNRKNFYFLLRIYHFMTTFLVEFSSEIFSRDFLSKSLEKLERAITII